MGNDGSGKTTTLQHVCRKLRSDGLEFEIVPGFDHLFIQHIKKIARHVPGIKMSSLQKAYSHESGTSPKRKDYNFIFTLWPFLVLIDCILIFVMNYLKTDKIVFFDRYFYDHALSFRELGYSSKLMEKLFLFFPKPDVGFVFDAEPDIAYSRKKHDHKAPLDYYIRQRDRYLRLSYKKNLPVINTSYLSFRESYERVFRSLRENPKAKRFSLDSFFV